MNAPSSPNGLQEPDSFDVKNSLLMVWDAAIHNKLLVAAVTVATLALVIVYVVLWPPIYLVQATVVVERDTDPARDSFYANWNVFRKDDARTEIELMTSGRVLKEVIEKENLKYDDVYHPFTSHAKYLWEGSWLGRRYKGTKEFFFGKPVTPDATPEQIELGKTLVDFKKGINIHPVGDSNLGVVTVKGPTPRVADVANTLVDTYMRHREERHFTEAKRANDILSEEVTRAGGELDTAAAARLDFSQGRLLAFDFQKEMQELKDLTDLEAAIGRRRAEVAKLAASLGEIDRMLVEQPETQKVQSVFELNTEREALKLKRMELESALALKSARYQESSPEISELRMDIASIQALIDAAPVMIEKATTEGVNTLRQDLLLRRNVVRAELEGGRAELGAMQTNAVRLRNHLATVPAQQQELRDLERDYALAQEKYAALAMKRAQTSISLATSRAAMPSMRVVDHASEPGGKWWPRNKVLFPATLMMGFGLGIAAAVVKTLFDGRISRATLAGGGSALPVYSTIAVPAAGKPFAVISRREASV